MRPGWRASEQRFTAVTPPNRLVTSRSSSTGGPAASDIAGKTVPLLQHPEDAPRQEQDHQHDDGAEEELVDVEEPGPDQLLDDEQAHRPEHRAPDGSLPPEERHHDHGDGGGEGEDRDRLDVALVP